MLFRSSHTISLSTRRISLRRQLPLQSIPVRSAQLFQERFMSWSTGSKKCRRPNQEGRREKQLPRKSKRKTCPKPSPGRVASRQSIPARPPRRLRETMQADDVTVVRNYTSGSNRPVSTSRRAARPDPGTLQLWLRRGSFLKEMFEGEAC